MSKENKNFEEEKESCGCENKCHCHEKVNDEEKCHCHEDEHECKCGKDCCCDDDCQCDDCECEQEKGSCHCQEGRECNCGEHCHCESKENDVKNDKSEEYLNLARQIQADFENFRRHALEEISLARINGQASVIEVFLPCLDTFKEAKKMITDEKIKEGIEMIENKINSALESLGVKKISSIGEKYNPHFHNVIAVMKDEEKENDVILDEYQAGYMFNDKVIRYAKVIVNKKED